MYFKILIYFKIFFNFIVFAIDRIDLNFGNNLEPVHDNCREVHHALHTEARAVMIHNVLHAEVQWWSTTHCMQRCSDDLPRTACRDAVMIHHALHAEMQWWPTTHCMQRWWSRSYKSEYHYCDLYFSVNLIIVHTYCKLCADKNIASCQALQNIIILMINDTL